MAVTGAKSLESGQVFTFPFPCPGEKRAGLCFLQADGPGHGGSFERASLEKLDPQSGSPGGGDSLLPAQLLLADGPSVLLLLLWGFHPSIRRGNSSNLFPLYRLVTEPGALH